MSLKCCSILHGRYNHWSITLIFIIIIVLFPHFYSCFHCRNISIWRDNFPFVRFYCLYRFIILLFWHRSKCHSYYTIQWITPIILLIAIILIFVPAASFIAASPLPTGETIYYSFNPYRYSTLLSYFLNDLASIMDAIPPTR